MVSLLGGRQQLRKYPALGSRIDQNSVLRQTLYKHCSALMYSVLLFPKNYPTVSKKNRWRNNAFYPGIEIKLTSWLRKKWKNPVLGADCPCLLTALEERGNSEAQTST